MNQQITMNQKTNTGHVDMDANERSQVIKALLILMQNIFSNGSKLVREFERDGQQVLQQGQGFFSELKSQIEFTRATLKGTPRYKDIIFVGVKILTSYKTLSTKKEYLAEEEYQEKLSQLHRKNAQRIYDLCVELRGGLIKMAQFLSSRKDLLPDEYVDVLSALQDDVPPVEGAAIIARVESELGDLIDTCYQEFDVEPLAAASLAQVHKAKLLDGTEVAVKVQTPGIDDVIDIDMSALKVVGWMFKDYLPQLDVETILSEIIKSIKLELDYENELANMELFRTSLQHNTGIVIPRPNPNLSTKKLITMDLIKGQKLTDYLDHAVANDKRIRIDKTFAVMIDSFCAQILQYGHFHSDPHPGNFLVNPEGKLVMLDFGSVQHNTPEVTQAYTQLVMAILSQNKEESARLLAEMGFETLNGKSDTLIEFSQVMMELFQKSTHENAVPIDPVQQAEELMELVKENPVVKLPDHFVMLGRVFSSIAGLYFHYRPDLNLFEIIFPYMAASAAGLNEVNNQSDADVSDNEELTA